MGELSEKLLGGAASELPYRNRGQPIVCCVRERSKHLMSFDGCFK